MPGMSAPADGVITRAVESMAATVRRFRDSLPRGARFIFMKGPNCREELEEMERTLGAEYRLLLDSAYVLPHSNDRRRLIVYEKLSEMKVVREDSRRVLALSSGENEKFKRLKSLYQSRGVKKHERALIGGEKIVREFLIKHENQAEALLYPFDRDCFIDREENPSLRADIRLPEDSGAPALWALDPRLFKEVDQMNTGFPLLLARVAAIPPWDPEEEVAPGITLFLPLSDPENLGAALRSAAAFDVSRVVLTEEAAHPYHPRAIRASAGACFDLELRRGPALGRLPESGPPLFILDREGEPLGAVRPPASFGLLLGREGRGVSELSFPGRKISIPLPGNVESLNAAVSLGIALYELSGSDGEED